jgi:N-acetylglucosamine-6-phosphate deacetylase
MKTAMHGNIAGMGYARLEIRDANIASVEVLGPPKPNTMFISPGFIDIQVNGFSGIDFSSPSLTATEVVRLLPCLWKTGVTTFCPTLITNSHDKLLKSISVLEEARRLDPSFESAVPCYHLEGPYISPLGSRGAHDPDRMRLPDWNEFSTLQMAAGGRIGIITIAPELSGALQFIRKAKATGVLVAIGHTDATPEQIHAAVDSGATLSTHWGNGCPQYIHRHTNPLWAQLADESLSLTLICDGFHLPRDVVRAAAQIKGTKKCVLITDAVHVANMPAGRYRLTTTEIELLPSGQVVTVDGRCMAGSAVTMNRAITVFMDFAQVSLSVALEAATSNPAELIQRAGICSAIAEGQPANLVWFRFEQHGLEIETAIFRGKQVYTRDRDEKSEAPAPPEAS